MPIITQAHGVATVKGLPPRWAARAYKELKAAQAGAIGAMPEQYKILASMLDEVTSAPMPLDATDAHLCVLAERYASECQNVALDLHDMAILRAGVELIVDMYGMERMAAKSDDKQAVLRYCDPAWWRRSLRRVHGRAFEHAAIRLGFVSVRAGAYCSDETVKRRLAQNRRNTKSLESVTMQNEDGQEYTLAALASKGTSNKSIRRGELMMRMAGCEDIATELGHVGLFVTLTNPSKYHAVLAKSGTLNPKFNGATPREAQQALMDVWTCARAKNGREGLAPYGFRIAEPHHDGCPHWHILMFAPADQVERVEANLRLYALAEDGDEPGAQANRVKFVRIDPRLGTAAGYIAKYVGKNIDDEHVGEHVDEDGSVIGSDLVGDEVIRPCQRVEAWAATWGIRQFQAIGQPPVTVWRELRRVEAERVAGAPQHVQDAWAACQRVEVTHADTGEVEVTHPADFAAYIRAQGGVNMGRHYRIAVAEVVTAVEGRYGLTDRPMPTGIYCRAAPDVTYASTRHTWRRTGVAVDLRRPRSPVNNCTDYAPPQWDSIAPVPQYMAPHDDSEHWGGIDFAFMDHPDYQDFVLNPENGAQVVAALATCERYERAFCFFEDI